MTRSGRRSKGAEISGQGLRQCGCGWLNIARAGADQCTVPGLTGITSRGFARRCQSVTCWLLVLSAIAFVARTNISIAGAEISREFDSITRNWNGSSANFCWAMRCSSARRHCFGEVRRESILPGAINAQEICFPDRSTSNIADWCRHRALVCAGTVLLQRPSEERNDAGESA